MGYTHYFSCDYDSAAYAAGWPHLIDRVEIVVANCGVVLAGPSEDDSPVVSPVDAIVFNGVAGDDYETFRIPAPGLANSEWSFCKTARRPYDLAVTAVLLCAHLLMPDTFLIWSDGDWDRDWRPARDLVQRLVGDVPQANPFAPPARRAR
jgi:hypothetical protein